MSKTPTVRCELKINGDQCDQPGTMLVEVAGREFALCASHRRMVEDAVPPTPTGGDEPLVLVREQYERWRQARRMHERTGDMEAASRCAALQARWHQLLGVLEGPQRVAAYPSYPKPWEVSA